MLPPLLFPIVFFKDTLNLSLAGCIQLGKWDNSIILGAKYDVTDQFSLYSKLFAYNLIGSESEYLEEYNHWGSISAGIRYVF